MSAVIESQLAEFGRRILAASRIDGGNDVDGGTIQDLAEELGLLVRVTVTEPCCDQCWCAEYDAFPQECLRLAHGVKP